MSLHGAPMSETRDFHARDTGPVSATSGPSKIVRSRSQLTHGRSVRRSSGATHDGSKHTPEEPTQKGPQSLRAKMPALSHSQSSSTKTRANSTSTRLAPSYIGRSPPLQSMKLASVSVPELILAARDQAKRESRPLSKAAHGKRAVTTTLNTNLSGPTSPPVEIPVALIPELQALAAANPPPPLPPLQAPSASLSSVGSPSTQLTSSTSLWSASATTTPVSWSSASPSVALSSSGSMSGRRGNPSPVTAQTKNPPSRPSAPKTGRRLSTPASVIDPTALTVASSTRSRANRRTALPTHARAQEPHGVHISALSRENVDEGRSARIIEKTYNDHIVQASQATTSLTALPLTAAPDEEEIGVAIFAVPPPNTSSRKESARTLPSSITSTTHTERRQSQVVTTKPPAPGRYSQVKPKPIEKTTAEARASSDSKDHQNLPDLETTRTSARSRLAKFSRLALFGRSKDDPAPELTPTRQRLRKGPTAGTGHEAHGKFGRRLRKPSTSSSNTTANDSDVSVATTVASTVATTVSRSGSRRQSKASSAGGTQNQAELDVFAASRLKPVALQGGSLRGRAHPFPLTPINTQHGYAGTSVGDPMASPRRPSTRRERCSSIFDEPSYLAARRSHRLPSVGVDPMTIVPVKIEAPEALPQPNNDMVIEPPFDPATITNMHRIDPALLTKQQKKSRMGKWNIFRKNESAPQTTGQPVAKSAPLQDVPVSITQPTPVRKLPYYAVLGSEAEVGSATNLGRYLREAAESPDEEQYTEDILQMPSVSLSTPAPRESILLPSAPVWPSDMQQASPRFTITAFENKDKTSTTATPKPTVYRAPRLASVGRIPKVVSSQQRTDRAFSMAEVPPSFVIEATAPSIEARTSDERPSRTNAPHSALTRKRGLSDVRKSSQASAAPPIKPTADSNQHHEFLRFSESQTSDFTPSSTSTSMSSLMGPSLQPAHRTFSAPQTRSMYEDEVWNEYDDFLDDVLSPISVQKQMAQKRRRSQPKAESTKPSTTRTTALKNTSPLAADRVKSFDMCLDLSSTPTDPGSPLHLNSSEETRLRRSRIAAALHSSYASTDPSSPFSMSEFISGYNRPDSAKYSQRTSGSSSKRASLPATSLRESQRELSLPRRHDSASQMEEIRDTQDPSKRLNKAHASLVVARWLSFGRVLVSPAHLAIETISERKVLVIDGLDSADWSVYCATAYQAQRAYVHDLKERKRMRTRQRTSGNAPANHRQAEIASFNNKFPFPPDFFHAIVVRFLPSMSDTKLKNILSECRRVLSPGGYLELMILDMDIVNMGVQTRRAIKDLKIKMSAVDPQISLKPMIDNVSGVLASHGFSNLNRCVIGVPVVGRPRDSMDSSSESRSSGSSFQQHRTPGRGAEPQSHNIMADQLNFSLNNLVADPSETADAEIGRLVSRTARNWWHHCFESSVMEHKVATKSVLSSKEVLKECKSRASNFKILIAYTQKPGPDTHHSRRTMSEPNVPTLATAGLAR